MIPFFLFWCEPIVKAPITCPAFWPQLSHSRFFEVGGCFRDQIIWMQCVPTRIIISFCWWIVEFPELRAWTLGPIWLNLISWYWYFREPSVIWHHLVMSKFGNGEIGRQITTQIGEGICIFRTDASALPFGASALSCGSVMGLYFWHGIRCSYQHKSFHTNEMPIAFEFLYSSFVCIANWSPSIQFWSSQTWPFI
jgi:hypothetical protein